MKREPRSFLEYLRNRISRSKIRYQKAIAADRKMQKEQWSEQRLDSDVINERLVAEQELVTLNQVMGSFQDFQGKQRIMKTLQQIDNKNRSRQSIKSLKRNKKRN